MKLIIARHFIDCSQDQAICRPQMGILIEGEHIRETAPLSQLEDYLQDNSLEIIDAGKDHVLPGLIDAHLHLCFDSSANPITALEQENAGATLLRMAAAAQTELQSGVTTVRDCGAKGLGIMDLKRATSSGLLAGPDIISCGPPITITGGHCHFLGMEADSFQEVQKAVRFLCKNQVDFIKVMVSGGNMTPGSNSLTNQYERDILEMITFEAHSRNKLVAGHIHTTTGIENAVAAGFDTIEHCSFKDPSRKQDVSYSHELAQRIAEQGISVCPAFGKAYILPPEEGAPLPEKIPEWRQFQQSRFETTKSMYEEGVNIIAGTDAGCKYSCFHEFHLTLMLLHQKVGMSPEDVLLSATSRAARAIGAGSVGSLEAGKKADLIFTDGNPLEDLTALSRVTRVIKNGKSIR